LAAGTGSSGASLATGTSAFPGKAADFSGSETPHPKSAAFHVPRPLLYALAAATLLLLPTLAFGQDVSIDFGDDTTLTERAVQLVGLITVLALAPSILVMVTSFTRIVVVLSLLRTAIGLQTAPPNSVMVSLALFLTLFIMQPTLQAAYDQGVAPLLAGQIEVQEAFDRGSVPLHDFMAANVREQDVQLFYDLAQETPPETAATIPLRILVPAFMISELRRAFEIGFLLFLPFVIIDMVVASVLMSMGMMMLPPVVISLPFKLIFFVLVDGWHLVAGSLVRSFTGT
jgi:flagellar biosynthetic protein FliP